MREFLFVFQDVDVACGRSASASEHVADDQRFPQPTAYAPRAAPCRPSALQKPIAIVYDRRGCSPS